MLTPPIIDQDSTSSVPVRTSTADVEEDLCDSSPFAKRVCDMLQTDVESLRNRIILDFESSPIFLSSPDVSTSEEDRFGYGWFEGWIRQQKNMCNGVGSLVCASRNHPDCRTVTYPHTMCKASSILLDPSHFSLSKTLQFRSQYNPDGAGEVYWRTSKGAFQQRCKLTSGFDLAHFSQDISRDLFFGYSAVGNINGKSDIITVKEPTLLVAREGGEYNNVFHTFTDLMNAFGTLYCFSRSTSEKSEKQWWELLHDQRNIRLFLLDANPDGYFDEFGWRKLFDTAPGTELRGIDVIEAGRSVMFDEILFSPPGYSSFLFSHLFGSYRDFVAKPTSFMKDFANYFLLQNAVERKSTENAEFVVTLVFRRPVKGRSKIDRKIGNENELVAVFQQMENTVFRRCGSKVKLVVQSHDFANMNFQEQMRIVANSDILFAVHGAACSHAIFLPEWGGLIEIWPNEGQRWRCFENIALWSGRAYIRLDCKSLNCQMARLPDGSVLTLPIEKIEKPIEQFLLSTFIQRYWWTKSK